MAEQHHQQQDNSSQKLCCYVTRCHTANATFHCIKCDADYCDQCNETTHVGADTRNHERVRISKYMHAGVHRHTHNKGAPPNVISFTTFKQLMHSNPYSIIPSQHHIAPSITSHQDSIISLHRITPSISQHQNTSMLMPCTDEKVSTVDPHQHNDEILERIKATMQNTIQIARSNLAHIERRGVLIDQLVDQMDALHTQKAFGDSDDPPHPKLEAAVNLVNTANALKMTDTEGC